MRLYHLLGPLALRLLERYLAHFGCLRSISILPTTNHLPNPLYHLSEVAVTIHALARDLNDLPPDDLLAEALEALYPLRIIWVLHQRYQNLWLEPALLMHFFVLSDSCSILLSDDRVYSFP